MSKCTHPRAHQLVVKDEKLPANWNPGISVLVVILWWQHMKLCNPNFSGTSSTFAHPALRHLLTRFKFYVEKRVVALNEIVSIVVLCHELNLLWFGQNRFRQTRGTVLRWSTRQFQLAE